VIAAHIDREAYGIIGQLGFIPPSLALDAVEVSRQMAVEEAAARFPDCRRYPVVTGSDAHTAEDIGSRYTCLTVEEGSIAEIKKALAGRDGRKAEC
jgi:PHP family Zn ribbon phosphoesterase